MARVRMPFRGIMSARTMMLDEDEDKDAGSRRKVHDRQPSEVEQGRGMQEGGDGPKSTAVGGRSVTQRSASAAEVSKDGGS